MNDREWREQQTWLNSMRRPCPRCGGDMARGCIMSKFNQQMICSECKEDERHAPGYAAVDAAEVDAVRNGSRNWQGPGLSPEDQKFLAERLAQRKKVVS